jgi:hypothetical protein
MYLHFLIFTFYIHFQIECQKSGKKSLVQVCVCVRVCEYVCVWCTSGFDICRGMLEGGMKARGEIWRKLGGTMEGPQTNILQTHK